MRSDRIRNCPEELRGYPGAKGGAGVFQRIISEIPEHEVYVEGFAGSAAIWRAIRPAARSILIDGCDRVAKCWSTLDLEREGTRFVHGRFLEVIDRLSRSGEVTAAGGFVYLDPPYLLETRTGERYQLEMGGDREHRELLRWATSTDLRAAISGYWSPLYAEMLQGWRKISYPAMTRGGIREEFLWMNYARPKTLHDARYAGDGFRERERLKRRRLSWASMFRAMTAAERQQVLAGLLDVWREEISSE